MANSGASATRSSMASALRLRSSDVPMPATSSGSRTLSRMVMRGSSAALGSWKMIWKRAAVPAQFGRVQRERVLAEMQHPSAGRRDQADDAAAERRLARTGFADHAEGLALAHPEGRPCRPPCTSWPRRRPRKGDLEILDRPEFPRVRRLAHAALPAARGSRCGGSARDGSSRARSVCGSWHGGLDVGAARTEAAAGRHFVRRRNAAGNRRQLRLALALARQRGEQPGGIGMKRARQDFVRPGRPRPPGRHTSSACARSFPPPARDCA